MRILIVDNGSSYIDNLLYLLENNDLSVIPFSSDIETAAKGADLVILSGGHIAQIEGNENIFKNEMDFVRAPSVPVIGICFGSELIARAFGAEISPLPEKEKGIIEIKIISPEEFIGTNEFPVFENHSMAVKTLPEELESAAISKDGVEIFRHKSLPVWGLQFHPETHPDKSLGDEFIVKLINRLTDDKIAG